MHFQMACDIELKILLVDACYASIILKCSVYVTGFAKRDLFDNLQKLSLAAIQVPLGLPFIVT